jgi:hypothetical protein
MQEDDHKKIDEILQTVKVLLALAEAQNKKIDILNERISNLTTHISS